MTAFCYCILSFSLIDMTLVPHSLFFVYRSFKLIQILKDFRAEYPDVRLTPSLLKAYIREDCEMDIESPPPSPPLSSVRPLAIGAFENPDSAVMKCESFMHTPATQGTVSTMAIRPPLVPAPIVPSSTEAIKPEIVQVTANQRTSAPANNWNKNAPPPSRNSVLTATPHVKSKPVVSTSSSAKSYGQSFD